MIQTFICTSCTGIKNQDMINFLWGIEMGKSDRHCWWMVAVYILDGFFLLLRYEYNITRTSQ